MATLKGGLRSLHVLLETRINNRCGYQNGNSYQLNLSAVDKPSRFSSVQNRTRGHLQVSTC
eukprot:3927895-Pleurochrysis_carterae.AAC.1